MEVNHGMVAFGGGVLIAAVAFVLTPIAIERLSLIWLIPLFFMDFPNRLRVKKN